MDHPDAHRLAPPEARDPDAEVVAYLAGRATPCPRCGYDLRDNASARCPECAEPLALKIASQRTHFGWLLVAAAPGCFSGVAAVFVLVPVFLTFWHRLPAGQGAPWPVMAADAFGFLSAASVWLMYRLRHRVMAWPARRQRRFAGGVWAVHVAALGLFVLGMLSLK